MNRIRRLALSIAPVALAGIVLFNTGCNKKPLDDSQIAAQIQSKIAADAALQGQQISVGVNNGAVTLSGNVTGQGSRELASNDAASIPGVKTVINNLVPQDGSMGNPPPGGQSYSTTPPPATAATQAPSSQRSYSSAPPAAAAVPQVITIPAGTRIRITLAQTLTSKSSQTGDPFSGTLADPITVGGQTLIRAGAAASGTVTDAKSMGRFKGQAVLAVRLDSIRANGRTYPVQTSQVERVESGKGKRTAIITGGGAGLGAIIGGLAGGGKGALIGGLLGAGAGGAGSAFTGNKDLVLPAESVLTFVLQSPVTVR